MTLLCLSGQLSRRRQVEGGWGVEEEFDICHKQIHTHTHIEEVIDPLYKPQKKQITWGQCLHLEKGKSRKLALFELSAYLSVIYWKIHKSLRADCGHTRSVTGTVSVTVTVDVPKRQRVSCPTHKSIVSKATLLLVSLLRLAMPLAVPH